MNKSSPINIVLVGLPRNVTAEQLSELSKQFQICKDLERRLDEEPRILEAAYLCQALKMAAMRLWAMAEHAGVG